MLIHMWTKPIAGALAMLLMLASGADAQAQQRRIIRVAPAVKVQRTIVIRTTDDDEKDGRRFNVRVLSPGDVVVSNYWIGLGCAPASPALRAQLGLDAGVGLVVQHVVPDGPAAKAGIQQHDVLVRAGEHAVKGIQELTRAVAAAKDEAIEIELVRGGERQTIEVTPAKRPESRFGVNLVPDRLDSDRVQKYFQQFQPSELPRFNFQFRRPGEVFALEFPDDLSIRVEKKGDKQAKITVEKGDEKWEVTEDALDELPEDVRRYVESVLGRTPAMKFQLAQPELRFFQQPKGDERVEEKSESDFGRSLEGLLERLEKRFNEQMESLLERLDELQKRIPAEDPEGASAA